MSDGDIENGIQGTGSSRSPVGLDTDPPPHDGTNAPGTQYNGRSPAQQSLAPRYIGRVTFTNQQREGQDGYTPEFVSRARMIQMAIARRDRYAYSTRASLHTPVGYTLSDLSISFDHLDRQWRESGNSYRYLGGTIYLDLTITLYVTSEAESSPRCTDLIMSHEMMHAVDESLIVTHTLPERLPALAYIRSDFQAPIPASAFDRRIRGSGNGSGSDLERIIQRSVWINMSSARAAELHTAHPNHGEEISRCLGS